MDYRDFLIQPQESVLPYLGGPTVFMGSRRLFLESEATPGWWRFEVKGRRAAPIEETDAPMSDELPKACQRTVRGHLLGDRLVMAGCETAVLHLVPPDDQPPRFSPCVAHRWPTGDLIFDHLEFESDAEELVRIKAEDMSDLSDLKGVPSTLRGAYGLWLMMFAAEALGESLHPFEGRTELDRVLAQGLDGAYQAVRTLVQRRRQTQARLAQRTERPQAPLEDPWRAYAATTGLSVRTARRLLQRRQRPGFSPERTARVEGALLKAGAELLDMRMANGLIDVSYRFMGERFHTLVQPDTLKVVDSGICLSGADDRLTLESLPAAIREAITTDALYVTRRT